MHAEISLRPACPDDEDWLVDLRRRTIVPYRAPLGLPNDDATLRDNVREHFEDAQIICDGDRRIGLFKAYREGDGWALAQIQLEPDVQGRGIGAALIRALQQRAAGEGVPLRLTVLNGNPARRLYDRLGFRQVALSEIAVTLLWQPDESKERQ